MHAYAQNFFILTPLFLIVAIAQVGLCTDCIAWAQSEKRTFLRQSLEVRLIQLYLQARNFQAALQRIHPLLKELKRLDDKALLVDVSHIMAKRS